MAKKRKTRQDKIISKLKRELNQKQAFREPFEPENTSRQEAISSRPAKAKIIKVSNVKNDNSVFSYDTAYIRRDLIRSLLLATAVIGAEIMLYFRLR